MLSLPSGLSGQPTGSAPWLSLNGENGSPLPSPHPHKSHHHIDSTLVDNRGGTFEQFRKDEDELKHLPKKLRRFYEAQVRSSFIESL